jgi:Ca2+-transporting ATPase
VKARAFPGLSGDAVRERLARFGPNELPRSRGRSFLAGAAHALAEPMFLLLLVAAGIYVVLGDRIEAAFLILSVAAIVAITLYQERRTARVLEALRDLSSPRALVIRDGVERRIPGREVVPDDLVMLREGDRVAADGRVLDSVGLHVDESLLTGESVPVSKRAHEAGRASADGAQDRVYAGTLVVKGHGLAHVTATGPRSEMGRIGQIARDASRRAHPTAKRDAAPGARVLGDCDPAVRSARRNLHRHPRRLAQRHARGPDAGDGDPAEEFPVVLTVFLALGAWRMSRVNVLTRRATAIEALGAATVLCVDKTGTLTQNRMAVRRIHASGQRMQVPAGGGTTVSGAFVEALRIGVLASEPEPFDPMERAFHELHGGAQPIDAELVHRYPLSSDLLVVTHVWRHRDASRITVAAKGAPESIIALCGLAGVEAARVLDEVGTMAALGLRVLGLASAELDVRSSRTIRTRLAWISSD